MALVVVFSTMSFTINMHYCGDTLVDTAIFNKAQSCGMDMNMEGTESQHSDMKGKCCSEKQLVVDGQDELQLQIDTISFEHIAFVASFVHTYFELFNFENSENPTFKHYTPPRYSFDLQVLNQVFLI